MAKQTDRIQQIGLLVVIMGTALFLFFLQNGLLIANAQTSTPIHQESEVVSGGAGHTCAITSDGGLKCWGLNSTGQLGNGNLTSSLVVTDVIGLGGGVAAVSAGDSHTCAVTSGGSAKCWGLNSSGQLGYGSTTNYNTPVDVVGLDINVTAISVGGNHSCALTSSGGVWCWGANGSGQVGDGTTTNRLTPVAVVGLSSGVVAISAGGAHTCVITSVGGVKCWGLNNLGQLGDGTTTNQVTPVDVTGLSSGVISLSAGANHNCVLTSTGGIKCWGYNIYGQIGDGTASNSKLTPVDVAGSTSGMASVSAGSLHTCASTSLGRTKCWGYGGNGQLGHGSGGASYTPVDVTGLSSGTVSVALGNSHSCALTTTGVVKCWGNNTNGRLGDGTSTQRTTPVEVLNFNTNASISTLTGHVEDQHGTKLVGFTVALDDVPVTQSGSVGFNIPNVLPGQHRITVSGHGYTFDQSPRVINAPYEGSLVFIGVADESPAFYEIWDKITEPPQPAPVLQRSAVDKSKEPLIILHGIQFGKGFECSAENGPYLYKDFKPYGIKPLGELAEWFDATGRFEVWVATLDTSFRNGTPSIQQNAECLKKQVEKIFEVHRVDDTSDPNFLKARNMHLVAHSMGGLVARSCISSYGCYHVQHLYTLGTLHGGVVASSFSQSLLFSVSPVIELIGCAWETAACQFSDIYMGLFNKQTPNLPAHHYVYIGGHGTPSDTWTSWLTSNTEGEGDGIVSKYSAIGLNPILRTPVPNDWRSSAKRNAYYWTDEVHAEAFFTGHDYYSVRDGQKSHAFECLRYEMGLRSDRPGFCETPSQMLQAAQFLEELPIQQTVPITGVILAGETITRQLQIDANGQTQFVLTWFGDTLTWILHAPDGQIITPSTADIQHLAVPAGATLPFNTYLISNTLPGLWQLQIANPSSNEAVYAAFARFESSRLLVVQIAHDTVPAGASQEFTATLFSGAQPITGASLKAMVYLPEETVTLMLNETNPGQYQASYTIPITTAGGIVNTSVTAQGFSDNTQFQRQQQAIWIVTPKHASLVGVTGHSFVDADNDQQAERLDMQVAIDVSKAATYTVIAHVSLPDGTLLTTGSETVVATPDMQNLTIKLDAAPLITNAQTSFVVNRLFLLEVDIGDITLDEKQDSYTFEIDPTQLTAPVLIAPEDNTTVEEGTKLTYQWQAVANAESYEILQLFNPASNPPDGNRVTVTDPTYTDQIGLIPGHYSWEVKAKVDTGLESTTNRRYFSVAPHNPTNVQARATSCQSVTLTWDDNSAYETGYHIYRNNVKIAESPSLTNGSGEYKDTALTEATTYEYKVIANHQAATLAGVTTSVVTPSCGGPTFTVTINSVGNGSVSPSEPGPYTSGTQVQLTATPDDGWRFGYWESTATLGDQATQSVITVTVTEAVTYTAHFVQIDPESPINTVYLPLVAR